jgi:hypothetical protein
MQERYMQLERKHNFEIFEQHSEYFLECTEMIEKTIGYIGVGSSRTLGHLEFLADALKVITLNGEEIHNRDEIKKTY